MIAIKSETTAQQKPSFKLSQERKMNIKLFLLYCIFVLHVTLSLSKEIQVNAKNEIIGKDKQCKPRPDSCKYVDSNQSRVVVILSSGLEVMCDTQTDGGGWTIFQRRINGNLSFYRGWEEYKYGFGDLANGEFYLGNEHIHRITVQRRHELRIDFSFLRSNYFAKYARFSLFGEPEGYRLKIENFSGDGGDSLNRHKNMMFSTYDKDLDIHVRNCASEFQGAWWYEHCLDSNLNGIWGNTQEGVGINWKTITGFYLSATMTEMKFRHVQT